MPKKTDEESAPLRRSSRTTRGSVKPIVDLTREESPEVVEEKTSKKVKAKKEKKDEEPEIILESDDNYQEQDDVDNNDDDDADEDYQETKTKSRRTSKKPAATAKSKKQPPADTTSTKIKAERQPASTSKAKSAAKSSKKQQKDDEAAAEDDDFEVLYELSEKELKEINAAFDMNCSDKAHEYLSNIELKTAMRSMGFEPRVDEIQKLSKKFSSKSGKINRDGFHKIMAFKIGSSPGLNNNAVNDDISRVFNLLDLDKTGMITLENLRSISKELNEEITDEELCEMICEADVDGDSQINREEFYNIMKKTSLY